jgi:hypothetical protein
MQRYARRIVAIAPSAKGLARDGRQSLIIFLAGSAQFRKSFVSISLEAQEGSTIDLSQNRNIR